MRACDNLTTRFCFWYSESGHRPLTTLRNSRGPVSPDPSSRLNQRRRLLMGWTGGSLPTLYLRDSNKLEPPHCEGGAFEHRLKALPAIGHGFGPRLAIVTVPAAEPGRNPRQPGERAFRPGVFLALRCAFKATGDGGGQFDLPWRNGVRCGPAAPVRHYRREGPRGRRQLKRQALALLRNYDGTGKGGRRVLKKRSFPHFRGKQRPPAASPFLAIG